METHAILKEIVSAADRVQEQQIRELTELLLQADRIFCDGLGRSGLACRGFGMRLMHLGLQSAFVGDTMTPALCPGDLLLQCSGSGRSEALRARAEKAKKIGAKVAVITGAPGSPLAKLADQVVEIPAPAKEQTGDEALLPMGSLFEDTSIILFEALVVRLMEKTGETGSTMMRRHANLE